MMRDDRYPKLKKFRKGPHFGNQFEEIWTLDNLKDGFQYFFDTNGHYPTAIEIDTFDYLPTSRTIQRRFGGLQELRKVLGLTILNFTAGEVRSESARKVGKRGFKIEKELEGILVAKFGKEFVHVEHPFGSSKKRVDFFVYCPSGSFGVDVFYPASIYNMKTILNLKIKAYKDFSEDNYLVVGNPEITQEQIDLVIKNKKKTLPPKCSTLTLLNFKEIIKNKNIYKTVDGGQQL